VEDEHTRGTRALESTIEAIAQEIRVSWLVYQDVRCRRGDLVLSCRQHCLILFDQNTCIRWISMLYVSSGRFASIWSLYANVSEHPVSSIFRQVGTYLSEDGIDSVLKRWHIKLEMQGNHPEESIQHSEHGEVWNQEFHCYCHEYHQGMP
jgi:hypothetical protein